MRRWVKVDHGRDHERTGENGGHGQHRASVGRASDDDEEAGTVGDREGAEVPGGVGGCRLLVAQQRGNGNDNDLDGDDGQQHPDDAPR